jgi:DNA-binding HxlR family transcriptional regulator
VLTERLRLLEESRIIYREHVASIPPQVTYGLSERGKELVTAMDELFKIAKRWCEEDGVPTANFCDGDSDQTTD